MLTPSCPGVTVEVWVGWPGSQGGSTAPSESAWLTDGSAELPHLNMGSLKAGLVQSSRCDKRNLCLKLCRPGCESQPCHLLVL